MGLFNNKIPSGKKAKQIGDKVMVFSQELKNIIISHNCVDFKSVNVNGLDYALFMYDLDFYRQVMSIKYSKFYIEFIIRTIFASMERNLRNAGNRIEENYLFNTYLNLSNAFHQIYNITKKEGLDEFEAVAIYLCSDELHMSDFEISSNEELIVEIATHFKKIINLPYGEI